MHQSLLDLSYHKYGNKSGKLLARLCKGPHTSTHITVLKDPSGNLTSSPKDINLILEQFYPALYGPDAIDEATALSFLDRVPLPTVNDTLLSQLNAPITLVKISSAIKSLTPGKAPGPDDYMSEFYKLRRSEDTRREPLHTLRPPSLD